jgi:hypothetical protein
MRKFFHILTGILTLVCVGQCHQGNVADHKWSAAYGSRLDLCKRASTLATKRSCIDDLVKQLHTGWHNREFATHAAIWYKTDANSFEGNYTAILSYQTRLTEIAAMQPDTPGYNLAMQEIQEHDPSDAISPLYWAWILKNYPYQYGTVGVLLILVSFLGTVAFVIMSCIGITEWVEERRYSRGYEGI